MKKDQEFEQRFQEWDNERKELKSDLTKTRQNISNLQEKNAILGSNVDRLNEELEAKKNEMTTLEQNMNASNLQCSTLQVNKPLCCVLFMIRLKMKI